MRMLVNKTHACAASMRSKKLLKKGASPFLALGMVLAPFMAHSAFATPLSEQPVTWTGTLNAPAKKPVCEISMDQKGVLGFLKTARGLGTSRAFHKGGQHARISITTDGDIPSQGVNILFGKPSISRGEDVVTNEFRNLSSGYALAGSMPAGMSFDDGMGMSKLIVTGKRTYSRMPVFVRAEYTGTGRMPSGVYTAKSTITCELAPAPAPDQPGS